ncbi:MAG TPA: NlpC/P60 family protein [Mycobacteriales bacterium]|nr:NlpC/P60 family protein [Mycobacteriales bacterium]
MANAPRIRHLLLRAGILSALSATTFGAFTGVAAATAQPVDAPASQPAADDPAPQPDPTTPAEGTDSPDRTVTFATPRAVTRTHAAHMRSVRARHAIQVRDVLRVAAHQRGKPYSYGGAGPRAFDCSGLVMYVFGKAVGRQLPHNAAAQYHAVVHIKKRNLQPGDLVFQESGGYPYHVGIYAGHGKWWHAPHSGTTVRKQRIYHGHKYYGRVLTTGFARHHTH